MAVDTKHFNPVFATKLNALFNAAQAAGINTGYIESAYRPAEQQAEIYERSGHGKKFMAAPPGHSMHGAGLATDVISPDILKLRAFATAHPEFGIYPLPGDTPHFQLAGNQRELMAHPPTGAPVNFVWNLGPNKEGTWRGTTLASNAVAPPHSLTPPTAGPEYTAPVVAAANPPSAVPATPPPPTLGQSLQSGDVGGALRAVLTKPPAKVDEHGREVEQKSPVDKAISAFAGGGKSGEQGQPEIPALPTAAPVQDPMMQMAPAASQLFAQVSAQAAKPLSWTSDPYGANAGLQRARQMGGTTLNSTDYGYG